MRQLAATVLALALAQVGGPAARADAPGFDGKWKLSALPFGNDEFAIVDVKTAAGKAAGTVLSAQPFLGPLKTVEVAGKGDDVTVTFPMPGNPMVFRGTLKGGKALGTLTFRGMPFPARLEKTEATEVNPIQPNPAQAKLMQAQREADPKKRVTRLLEVIHENPGHPMNARAYVPLLGAAEDAKLTPEEVRGHAETWVDEAKAYGPLWAAEVRSNVLKGLQGKKAYAGLATELAREAEKALPADAPLDLRAGLAAMLARSARLAGKDDVAAAAESRAKEIEAKLDAEYHEKVPPFKPATFSGRKDPKNDRAVVMEIFTGAQCPPCVAADVGFDALLTTYKPTEFIGLQYHLHIPGPDPLTNPDAIDRQKYYGDEVGGTPSTFFNGKSAAGGGGGMQGSEGKYDEFRKEIDPALETEPQADVTLTADRSGDEIKITAGAHANAGAGKKAGKPRLRLVLVEKAVRYTGGNKLRFHHNVVRAFPGGVAGKALDDGKAAVTATVNLSDLRKSLNTYLDGYPASGRPFPNPLPPIDLNGLAVVALVQDDADHAIWQARQVSIKDANP